MSASPAAPSREPQHYGLSPAHACADQDLSDGAHRVLTALGIIARGNPGGHATGREIGGKAGGKDPRTVRRHMATLLSLGYITRDVAACEFTFRYELRGRSTPGVAIFRAPEEAAGPDKVDLPPPDKVDLPPRSDLSYPPEAPPTPPYSGTRASEESGREGREKDYLPTPNPIPDPPACACEGRATARHPLNPFADPPPEVIAADPILSREWAARAARAGRVGS